MRVVVQRASHVILMGYGLPPDDVTYRAFLAARTSRGMGHGDVRCSVVNKVDSGKSGWLYPHEMASHGNLPDVVRHARELFGDANVRFYGAGIPQVFLGAGGQVTEDAVSRLLDWELP